MKLSVIIPCRNAVKTIAAQLDALCHQQWHGGWEVIVADNGSTDGTQDVVARFCGRLPGLRLIDASARRGAAHARNIAVEESSGEALAFCDADDEVGIAWLTAIGNALTHYDFVASRMDVDKLNPPWLAVTLNNVQGKDLRRAYYPPFLFHAGSSGMGVKRELHDRVGGFDETLREREDTDYCFRIQLQGVMLHFVSDATIHIRYSDKSEALFRQARQWARYQVLLYKRYGGGMPLDQPWSSYLQTWRDLIGCMPRAFRRETRPAWMKTLGTQIGLLEGTIRYRVPPVCTVYGRKSPSKARTLPMPAYAERFLEPQLDRTNTRVNFSTGSCRQALQAENASNLPKENESPSQKLLMFFVGLSSNVGAISILL